MSKFCGPIQLVGSYTLMDCRWAQRGSWPGCSVARGFVSQSQRFVACLASSDRSSYTRSVPCWDRSRRCLICACMTRNVLVEMVYAGTGLCLRLVFGLRELLDLHSLLVVQTKCACTPHALSSLAFSSCLSSSSSLLFDSLCFSLSLSFSFPFRFSRFNFCLSSYSFFSASISRSNSSCFFWSEVLFASSASG
jgi:hypothetical protein